MWSRTNRGAPPILSRKLMEYRGPIIVTKEEASPIPGHHDSQELSNPDESHKLEALSADSINKQPAETSLETELEQELLALQRLVEKLKTASITANPNPIQVSE